MSASLVGSEMCIRDSRRHRPPHLPVLRTPHRVPEPALGGAPRFSSAPSVSYTHLTLPTICSV
eukprot:1540445-Alexandrium_andersonii.AAC.1